MGIPIIIPTNREGFKRWIKVVGVILIAGALYFSATKIEFSEPKFVKEGTVPFSEMNKTDVYEVTNIIVFDNYAKLTKNSAEYEYFTILVKDNDGNSKYLSVVTNVKDGIYEKLISFRDDLSLSYGECILNGGFTALKMDDIEMDKSNISELKNLYNADLSNCQQIINAEASDVILTYVCASEAEFPEYKEQLKGENIKWAGIAAALVAGGIICIVIGVLMSKKDKKKLAEAAEVNAQYYNPQENSDMYYTPGAVSENSEAEPAQQEYAAVSSSALPPEEISTDSSKEE